jgi:hypothetical protein
VDASIEVIDRVVGEGFTVTALQGPTAAELAHHWVNKRQTLLHEVRNRDWISLDCVNLGKCTDSLKPTIVITAADADAWDQTMTTISALFDHKLEIQFLYRSCDEMNMADDVTDTDEGGAEMSDVSAEEEEEADFAAEELAKPKGIANMWEDEVLCRSLDFSTEIYPGTSVGVKGGPSGTVGGSMEIEFPGQSIPATQGGLTSFHRARQRSLLIELRQCTD